MVAAGIELWSLDYQARAIALRHESARCGCCFMKLQRTGLLLDEEIDTIIVKEDSLLKYIIAGIIFLQILPEILYLLCQIYIRICRFLHWIGSYQLGDDFSLSVEGSFSADHCHLASGKQSLSDDNVIGKIHQ